MSLTNAQQLFVLFFGIHFTLIVERAHETYRPWDTYNAWEGNPYNIKRFLISYLILIIIPILHFGLLFVLIGTLNIRFDMTFDGISNVVLISLSSFFEFGYFRIYEAYMHVYPEYFFTKEEITKQSDKILPNFRSHFVPGLVFILLSTIVLLIAIYY
jgi:hypothetical protein